MRCCILHLESCPPGTPNPHHFPLGKLAPVLLLDLEKFEALSSLGYDVQPSHIHGHVMLCPKSPVSFHGVILALCLYRTWHNCSAISFQFTSYA